MRKLNLANLAQDELKKEEAQKAKGGLICYCACSCSCPPDYKIDVRIADKIEERTFVLNLP